MDKKFEEILNEVNTEIMQNRDCNLIDEGIVDSLAIMNLIVRLESEYSIEIDPNDLMPENFSSVEAIWNLVQKNSGKG